MSRSKALVVTDNPAPRGARVAKWAVAAGALGYLVTSGRLDPRQVAFHPERLPAVLPLGVALLVGVTLLGGLRWHLLLDGLGMRLRYRDTLRVVLVGGFFNTFLLGSVGGDVVRLAYVGRATGRAPAAAASLLVDRLAGMAGLLLVAAGALALASGGAVRDSALGAISGAAAAAIAAGAVVGAICLVAATRGRSPALLLAAATGLLTWAGGWNASSPAGAILLSTAPLAAVGALFLPAAMPGRPVHRLIARLPFGTVLSPFLESLVAFHRLPGRLVSAVLLGAVMQASSLGVLVLVAHALGHAAAPARLFVAAPAALVANTLPVPLGGLGVGEASFDAALSLFRNEAGQPEQGGALLFLAWRIAGMLYAVLAGLPFFLAGNLEPLSPTAAAEASPRVDSRGGAA